MGADRPHTRARRMTSEELNKIRDALKQEGIPFYPDRIVASPDTVESAPVKPKRGPRPSEMKRRHNLPEA